MKKVKYFIFLVLVMAGFLFNGELFTFYLDNFQESYYRSSFAFFDLEKGITDEEIKQDFLNAGKNYDVDFFMVDSKIKSAYKKEITIYGTDSVIKNLSRQGISGGEYTSLFTGNTIVRYEDFSTIKDITKYEYCYFLGDGTKLEDFKSFKSELIDKYGGGFPKLYGSERETRLNLFFVWVIVFSLTLVATVYEVFYQKKETIIRIILGENIKTIFIKNIVLDTCIFSLIFIIVPMVLSDISNVYFKISYIKMFFIIFQFLNILLNATILHVEFKRDIAGSNSEKSLLAANYALKTVTTILAIILLSSNFLIIAQGIDYYQQRDFFEKHKNYSYYRLNYKINNSLGKTESDESMINQIFYKRFQEQSFQYIDMSDNLESDYPILLINKTTMKELSQVWPNLEKIQKNINQEKVYIILPLNLSLNSKEYICAENIYNYYFGNQFENDMEIITYEDNLDLVGIHNQITFKSKMTKNPIFFYNNTTQEIDKVEAETAMYYVYDTMYDIPDNDFQNFVGEFQLEDEIVIKSNVFDVYKHNWEVVSRSMKITLALSTFLILLEMMMIIFIIKMEYQFNSVEMALKKTYGYTLFQRNIRIIKITLVILFLSILGAFVLNYIYGYQTGFYLILGGLLLLVLELVYIINKAQAIEKLKISGILKGERI